MSSRESEFIGTPIGTLNNFLMTFATWRNILLLIALSREYLRGSITVLLTSCWTSLEMCICAVHNSVHPTQTRISKPVKQEVNCTMILTLSSLSKVVWQGSCLPPSTEVLYEFLVTILCPQCR